MDLGALADRYALVKAMLPASTRLIAVSKKRSVEEIRALYDLGQRAFGENYPQELCAKQPLLPADIEWHFIGHLQTNKVKAIIAFVHTVHGVDSEKLADELDKRAASAGRTVNALFQVHIAREETKHGFLPDELRTLLQQAEPGERWPSLRFRGLMGMATNTPDQAQVADEFNGLARLLRELRATHRSMGTQFKELSMGMSGDLEQAIAAGSTMVRIGTAIFGPRD